MNKSENEQTLLTVRQFAEHYPAFREGGLRHLIFHAESNGFKKCIRRIGRRVLLHVPSVFNWIEEENQARTATL
ncbi:MAG: hypothetical protein KDI13_09435 [Alphaproteobacteria bacterium]|nr:hypothetical protein [Alphaproteobacteria bacterium]